MARSKHIVEFSRLDPGDSPVGGCALCGSGFGRRIFDRSKIVVGLSLLFVLAVAAIKANTPGWQRQRLGTMAWLHSVFFLDQDRGWIVGSKGTMLTTIDGGKTWQHKSSPTSDILRDIFFSDDKNGWLVCEKNIYELKYKDEPRTYLMQTIDGGDQWKRIDIQGLDVDIRLVRVVFTRAGRGWAFGEAGSIYTTKDGGLNWQRVLSPTRNLLLGGIFIDEYRGWLVGAGATIIQTADGGDSWHITRLPNAIQSAIRFSSASFIDNRIGWAVGSQGSVYQTINGGRTWETQNSGVTTDLYDVKFLNAFEGWAVGAHGTIIYTNDGGSRWTSQRSGTEHPLERIFLIDRSRAWAVGFGGTVVTYVQTPAPTLEK